MPDPIEWPFPAKEIVAMLPKLSPQLRQEAIAELKKRSPVPWCHRPEECAVTGRCPCDPVCNN
jgi:hypothetical protein